MFERGTTPCRPIGFAGALALLLAAPASASPEEPVQAGAESPQELGKLLQEVAAADDPAEMIGLVVPEDRPQLAMLQLLPAIFMVSMAEPLGDMVTETGEADRDLPPITDYRIEGDRATARHGDEELVFRRVDDRWYLVLAETGTPY